MLVNAFLVIPQERDIISKNGKIGNLRFEMYAKFLLQMLI